METDTSCDMAPRDGYTTPTTALPARGITPGCTRRHTTDSPLVQSLVYRARDAPSRRTIGFLLTCRPRSWIQAARVGVYRSATIWLMSKDTTS